MKTWRRLALVLFPFGVPVASLWVWHRERVALRLGRALTASEMEDARNAGVRNPERIRIRSVPRIELFEHRLLNRLLGGLQDAFASTLGITLQYAILVRCDWEDDRRLLVHELAHVAQYERYGGITPFLLQYFRECIRDGYPFSALEREAVSTALRICGEGTGR